MSRIYYSPSENGFFDTRVHGERTVLIVDPEWTPPTIPVDLQPGEGLPDGSYINDTEAAVTLDVPDADAVPLMLEVTNTDCTLPLDAVEISAATHSELLLGNAQGQLIVPDDNGLPILTAPAPPTAEQLAARATAMRAQLLQAAAQSIAPLQDATDIGEATEAEQAALLEWKRYRVQLSRIERQPGYPHTIEWPPTP